MRVRLLIAQMLALASLGCGDAVTAPPPPPAPPCLSGPPTCALAAVLASSYPTVDSALRVAEATNQPLDMGGVARTVALQIHANPNFAPGTNQARFVKIINCGSGLTSPDSRPILSMAPGVSGYFVGLDGCLLLPNGVAKVLVDFSRMYSASFRDVWAFCGQGDTAYAATGPAYYNRWDGGLIGCGTGIKASGTGAPSSGPNTNHIDGMRFNGVGTGLLIGPLVSGWTLENATFETCSLTCLDLAGTRLTVGAGNWFEAGSLTQAGITLRAGSDGWIAPQQWSSFGPGLQIVFAAGSNPAAWLVASQPPQNSVTP